MGREQSSQTLSEVFLYERLKFWRAKNGIFHRLTNHPELGETPRDGQNPTLALHKTQLFLSPCFPELGEYPRVKPSPWSC